MFIHALLISKQGGVRNIWGKKGRRKGTQVPEARIFADMFFKVLLRPRCYFISAERKHILVVRSSNYILVLTCSDWSNRFPSIKSTYELKATRYRKGEKQQRRNKVSCYSIESNTTLPTYNCVQCVSDILQSFSQSVFCAVVNNQILLIYLVISSDNSHKCIRYRSYFLINGLYSFEIMMKLHTLTIIYLVEYVLQAF